MTTNMSQGLSRFALIVGLFTVALNVGYRGYSQGIPATPVNAFMADQRILHTPGTQSTPVVQRAQHGRRSDGSYVRKHEVESPDGEKGWAVEIHDLRSNRSITLEPFTKSAMTFFYTSEKMRKWLVAGQENCSSPEIAAALNAKTPPMRDSMQGREVLRVLKDDIDDNAAERLDAWVAPDLDCFVLQKTIARSTGAIQETTVTKLTEAEPPDSMFEIPADYIETSPLEVEAAYQAKFPGYVYMGQMANVIHERYVASRAKD